jgi:hypothetical protein
MTYDRLDRKCRARVLAVVGDSVLMTAMWTAQRHDEKRFHIVNGEATNTLNVSRRYFEQKYGVAL